MSNYKLLRYAGLIDDVRTLATELFFVLHRSTHIAVCVLRQIRLPSALTILCLPNPCSVVHTLSLQICVAS
jgi:hypothetical protein